MSYQAPSEDKDKLAGVTLIELLLVIAIIAILGGAVTPFLSRFVLQTNFDTTKDKVISSIRKSQEYAMDGRDGESWGVCVTGGNIRLYSGSCANPAVSENFAVPSTVSVTGLFDTTFNSRGEPSSTVSITVSTSQESTSVGVNSAGGITID